MAARSAVDGYTKKVAGFTCHEILPNFGNQTVILELISPIVNLQEKGR